MTLVLILMIPDPDVCDKFENILCETTTETGQSSLRVEILIIVLPRTFCATTLCI
jgi:hypothetical protein